MSHKLVGYLTCFLVVLNMGSCASPSDSQEPKVTVMEVAAVQTALAVAGNDLEGNFRGEVLFESACDRVIPFNQLRVDVVPVGGGQDQKSADIKIFLEKATFDRNINLNPSKKYQARLINQRDESVMAKVDFQVQKVMKIILRVSCPK